MLVQQKIGSLNSFCINNKKVDWLSLEWFETNRRILHKQTQSGKEVAMKFLRENQNLTQGDIIYEDAESVIAIDIQPCDVIVIKPKTSFEIASVCYEIGNKHLLLFYDDNELLIAYEAPLYNMLAATGYNVRKEKRKLLNPLRTSVLAHSHGNTESLFSKILKLTTPAE